MSFVAPELIHQIRVTANSRSGLAISLRLAGKAIRAIARFNPVARHLPLYHPFGAQKATYFHTGD
jgi:hypothetical protein